jgi:hypothetical protein
MIFGLINLLITVPFLDDEKNCKKSKIIDYFKTKTTKIDTKIVEENINNPAISVVNVSTPCK